MDEWCNLNDNPISISTKHIFQTTNHSLFTTNKINLIALEFVLILLRIKPIKTLKVREISVAPPPVKSIYFRQVILQPLFIFTCVNIPLYYLLNVIQTNVLLQVGYLLLSTIFTCFIYLHILRKRKKILINKNRLVISNLLGQNKQEFALNKISGVSWLVRYEPVVKGKDLDNAAPTEYLKIFFHNEDKLLINEKYCDNLNQIKDFLTNYCSEKDKRNEMLKKKAISKKDQLKQLVYSN